VRESEKRDSRPAQTLDGRAANGKNLDWELLGVAKYGLARWRLLAWQQKDHIHFSVFHNIFNDQFA
jgi:hypothetical protein